MSVAEGMGTCDHAILGEWACTYQETTGLSMAPIQAIVYGPSDTSMTDPKNAALPGGLIEPSQR